MALSAAEKNTLAEVAGKLRDIASGTSGNRRHVLEHEATVLDALADGARGDDVPSPDPAVAAGAGQAAPQAPAAAAVSNPPQAAPKSA